MMSLRELPLCGSINTLSHNRRCLSNVLRVWSHNVQWQSHGYYNSHSSSLGVVVQDRPVEEKFTEMQYDLFSFAVKNYMKVRLLASYPSENLNISVDSARVFSPQTISLLVISRSSVFVLVTDATEKLWSVSCRTTLTASWSATSNRSPSQRTTTDLSRWDENLRKILMFY